MGDRTNITDARQHDAEQAAGVIEQAMRNEGLIDKDVRLMGEIIAEALDAAGFDVVLRADPDTSDELAAEARRLLDAATPGPWKKDRGTWDAANDTTDVRVWPKKLTGLSADEIAVVSTSWIGASGADRKRARANAALIAAAPRLIAALLAERDAERAARERAETEARQLREAIGDPDELIANAHYGRAANGHGDDLFATVSRIAAAVAEGAEDRRDTE